LKYELAKSFDGIQVRKNNGKSPSQRGKIVVCWAGTKAKMQTLVELATCQDSSRKFLGSACPNKNASPS
jgi:hypothetical protein